MTSGIKNSLPSTELSLTKTTYGFKVVLQAENIQIGGGIFIVNARHAACKAAQSPKLQIGCFYFFKEFNYGTPRLGKAKQATVIHRANCEHTAGERRTALQSCVAIAGLFVRYFHTL